MPKAKKPRPSQKSKDSAEMNMGVWLHRLVVFDFPAVQLVPHFKYQHVISSHNYEVSHGASHHIDLLDRQDREGTRRDKKEEKR